MVLEFVRRDALAAILPALPIPAHPDLKALPVGRREDGLPWLVRLHGTHVLVAGATGAGKASLLWGLIRAMLPAHARGLVRVLAADPKLMELAYGRVIFDTHGHYAAHPAAIAAMLDAAVADMQARAAQFAGRQRDHTPTRQHPFTVVLVDEVAFLTAYQPDRKLRERIMNALATLTTQGRAVGYCVVAALQDPRKDVLTIRNLFPDRIAMRLDEPEQIDMVLGDGARDRGAACELISTDPATGAGVAFVRLEADPDPVRVRAGWVTDADIRDMADQVPATPAAARAGRGCRVTAPVLWQTDDCCPLCGEPAAGAHPGRRVDHRTSAAAAGLSPGRPTRKETSGERRRAHPRARRRWSWRRGGDRRRCHAGHRRRGSHRPGAALPAGRCSGHRRAVGRGLDHPRGAGLPVPAGRLARPGDRRRP